MVSSELVFITGGVRSGKSAFAEKCLVNLAATSPMKRLVYVATGVPFDEEMKQRIIRHQNDRAGQKWTTIEQPTDFSKLLSKIKEGDAILWDCVTTWLTNEFYDGYETGVSCFQKEGCIERKFIAMQNTIYALRDRNIPIVVVSNEVLDEPLSTSFEVRLYQKWLGRIHQWFVAEATTAIEMEYGQMHQWK
ncbi:bifunctional adenosylcobinamide kinase/adenosylcobinamide-phosphate guanylyltransferase [Viridibacillus sp. FSL R5-0477]|uniref:Adenosylcobinamide kinase n=1 Tax=Viridibacillus arenosi FSL R5-213 TaxID=1227360 RepID=W4F309_9BACL|nr:MULTISPECIES: bifunctional adenosylcobinamide kinase/adenosylcobinamide-phosphate guanylyltransferase [Viridibacillus]ETT87238.1 cobinamide kinase/cobinamide phosphate guanylyltransferase [Viridibacillus arenosi FSL R5-213]OMC80161.1 cobinamide kinase [Viridibacillus sp. FSL H8-0123]OMC91482.1 cobinamide kinase [Viridibacillus arenosi]